MMKNTGLTFYPEGPFLIDDLEGHFRNGVLDLFSKRGVDYFLIHIVYVLIPIDKFNSSYRPLVGIKKWDVGHSKNASLGLL